MKEFYLKTIIIMVCTIFLLVFIHDYKIFGPNTKVEYLEKEEEHQYQLVNENLRFNKKTGTLEYLHVFSKSDTRSEFTGLWTDVQKRY